MDVLASQNGLKLDVIYNVYVIYFWILIVGSKLKWFQIKAMINHFTFWPLDWNKTIQNACIKLYDTKYNYRYHNYF
jgi:hypothetical protein